MLRYVVINKKVGETPLQVLEAWKASHAEYKDIPASYAGRLDPMAEGKLLVLLGEECKRQTAYTGLDKEYEVEVLLDIGSDTGDALGIVTYSGTETSVDPHVLKDVLQKERGSHMRTYPAYSSKTVKGKPLFMYALEGTLNTILIPEHIEKFYRISLLRSSCISSTDLSSRIESFLAKVPKTEELSKVLGRDFRINEVRASWDNLFAQTAGRNFVILTLRITCASGAYMRSFAGRMGEALGTKALALSINRTKIGKFTIGFWTQTYS